jgi:hypothetical protein
MADSRIAQDPAQARQHGQVLGHCRRHQEEEQFGRRAVDRPVRNSLGLASEHNDRPVHQPDEGVARVRQRDAIADARAIELFAFAQGPQQGVLLFRLAGDGWNLVNQLFQHRFAIRALQIQIDRRRRQQAGQRHRSRFFHRPDVKEARAGGKKNLRGLELTTDGRETTKLELKRALTPALSHSAFAQSYGGQADGRGRMD